MNGCCSHVNQVNQLWGHDWETNEPVNLISHCGSGFVGYDDEGNCATEHTIDALVQIRKGGKKGSGKGAQNVCFACGKPGHRAAECRSTTYYKPKGSGKGVKGKSFKGGKGNQKGKSGFTKGDPKGKGKGKTVHRSML